MIAAMRPVRSGRSPFGDWPGPTPMAGRAGAQMASQDRRAVTVAPGADDACGRRRLDHREHALTPGAARLERQDDTMNTKQKAQRRTQSRPDNAVLRSVHPRATTARSATSRPHCRSGAQPAHRGASFGASVRRAAGTAGERRCAAPECRLCRPSHSRSLAQGYVPGLSPDSTKPRQTLGCLPARQRHPAR